MITIEVKNLVRERLQLLKQLINAKEHFKGHHLATHTDINNVGHPFKHYAALRIYLALTCFDILGQPDEWMDFQSWLKSNRKQEERNIIFLRHQSKEFSERLTSIHKDYTAIYGVKNSFYRFIREVISEENRVKLLNSIGVMERIREAIYYEDGSHSPPLGVSIKVSDELKEKFLFSARNSFTHKGISYGDPSGWLFDYDKPFYISDEDGPLWHSQNLITQKIGDKVLTYQVWKWPFLLIEIIESVLEQN